MLKALVYSALILLIVGLGLYFELNSGDYLIVERRNARSTPAQVPIPQTPGNRNQK